MDTEKEVVSLYLDDIIPNRFQPREVFDEQGLKELASSIKEHGIIQPIIVRKIGDKYEIIAGERRYKASIIAGKTTIPAIIRSMDDKESSKVALLENLQRKNLTAIEEARTYQKILDIDKMTQEELAITMGKSQSAVANKLRLLTLPDEVQDALLNDQISERHARSLLNLKDKESQLEMLQKIIDQRMTVRELENTIHDFLHKEEQKKEEEEKEEETKFVNITNDEEVQDTFIRENQPSVGTNSNIIEPIDLDKLRSQATSIIPPEPPKADLDSLLKMDPKEEEKPVEKNYKFVPPVEDEEETESQTPSSQEVTQPDRSGVTATFEVPTPQETEPNNSIQEPEVKPSPEIEVPLFEIPKENKLEPVDQIEDLDFLEDIIEKPIPKENTEEVPETKEEEPITQNAVSTPSTIVVPEAFVFDLKSAINAIRETLGVIEKAGYQLDTEELDFEDNYQINIKINKDKE